MFFCFRKTDGWNGPCQVLQFSCVPPDNLFKRLSVFLSCKQTRQLFIDPSQNGASAHLHIRHLLLEANGAVTIETAELERPSV